MNKVEIKKAVGVIQNELTKYGLMTPGNGIDFKVSIMVEQIENDRGRVVPHLVAKWNETASMINETKDGFTYGILERESFGELNRYFCAELFVKGITQRAAWIKADHKDCVEYLKSEPFGHPALFPVWKESQKVSA